MEKVFEKFNNLLDKFLFFGKLDNINSIEGMILSNMLLEIDGEGNIIKYPRKGGLLEQPGDWMTVLSIVVNKVRQQLKNEMRK